MKQQPIVVQTHSHQYFAEDKGVPLLWCQAVARFPDEARGNQIKQVPAVVLQTANGPKLVLLQDYCRHTEIRPLRPDEPTAMPVVRWWHRLWARVWGRL